MKIKIANLGVIKNAEIDLKPLTVFIGRNGTGKTWTAYTLSAILGRYGLEKYAKAYLEGKTLQKYPLLEQTVTELIAEGSSKIDIVNFASEYAEIYLNDLAKMAIAWLPSFMATQKANFKDLQIQFSLDSVKQQILSSIKISFIENKMAVGSYKRGDSINAIKESEENTLYFYSEGDILSKLPKRVVENFVYQHIFLIIHRGIYPFIYLLPTERTAFITFPLAYHNSPSESGIDDSGEDDELTNLKSPLVQPIQNFLENIRMTHLKDWQDREAELQENKELLKYVELANLLERQILQGNVSFETSLLSQELLFQPDENTKLEIRIASSMVKELAPLVLLLRYLVEPNELIIFDEPEMNLHPATQVELIEFLAMLVNAGLNVLITTHSPYIVDHLANLMRATKHEDPEQIKEIFYLENSEAFIPQEKVSIYLFEDGTVRNIVDDQGIIDWSTFGDVSRDLSAIYSRLP